MSLTKDQIDSIMHEYDQRQMDRHRLIEQRKKEINEKIPEYKEIDNQIASESVKAGIAAISGNSQADIRDRLDELQRKKNLLLTQNGFSINYLNPPYKCPYCRDTGYVGSEICHCFKQAILDGTYQNPDANTLRKEETFDTVSYEIQSGEDLTCFMKADKAARNFVSLFDKENKNILFKGNPGTGKSFLSNCIANEIIKKGYSVIYSSSSTLFERISSYKFSKEKSALDNPMDDIYNCDLLIIDDLGSEFTNQFVNAELFSIVNERYLRKRSTIISTNLDFKDISLRYTERTFSRIYSNYDTYNLSGNDARIYKKRNENRK